MGSCLSIEERNAWIHGGLEEARSAALGEHLARCARCREAVEATRGEEALFQELRTSDVLAPPGPPVIPGYELLEELHRGGQGIVYRALQKSTRRVVAFKRLAAEGPASYRAQLRFEREVELACRLRHPGIVTLFDSGVAGGVPYYAMELVDGCTLDRFLERHRPPLRGRLELFGRIAEAVTYAHRRGVIHRDLKPANILVDGRGQPRVLDFGVARAVGPDAPAGGGPPAVTLTGEFTGTLAYASPEQVHGEPAGLDTRTDVYSLGVVLYEMVTGHLPYDVTGGMSAAVASVTEAEPAEPGVDSDLRTVLLTALEKDPGRRYSSCEALARDVAHYLAHEPIEARRRTAWYELRKGLRRRRLAVAGSAALVLLVLFGSLAWLRERLHAERQRSNAELVREVFQDLLAAASPQRMGSDVKLLEVFGEVAARIESTLEDAPDTQAAVQLTIGDTYRRLLMMEEAEPHLAQAVTRYRIAEGAGPLELARALHLHGLVLSHLNRPTAAAVNEEALALRRRALGEQHPAVAESEQGLAIALYYQWGQPELARAEELARTALGRLRAVHGDDHPDVAECRVWLGRILRGRPGEPRREAGSLFAAAQATFERHAPRDPRMIECLNARASHLSWERRFDEAEALLDRSVVLTAELHGDERSTEMLRRYADLQLARGDVATAERLSRQALATELERWARRQPAGAERLSALARALTEPDGGRGEAEALPYAEAFGALREFWGDGSFELAGWVNRQARMLRELGRPADLEPLLQEALAVRCRAFGRDCPIRQTSLELLAEHRIEEGRGDRAVPLLEETLAIYGRQQEDDTDGAQQARQLMARAQAGAAPARPEPE